MEYPVKVDLIADLEGRLVPFEVKYRAPEHTRLSELKGLIEFCPQHQVETAYVITRELGDFEVLTLGEGAPGTRLLKIPAPLACYWLGRSELEA